MVAISAFQSSDDATVSFVADDFDRLPGRDIVALGHHINTLTLDAREAARPQIRQRLTSGTDQRWRLHRGRLGHRRRRGSKLSTAPPRKLNVRCSKLGSQYEP